MRKKVCVVGIDGATFKILEMIGVNYRSVKAPLISTIPPYTPPAWTSILTGVNPGYHGAYGFFKVRKCNVSLNTAWDVKFPRLFEMLAMHKLKSVIANIPLTYPVKALTFIENYVVISDWFSPSQFIWPLKFHKKYKNYLREPPRAPPTVINIQGFMRNLYEYIKVRSNIYFDLLEKDFWDFYFIIFSVTDWVLHKYPKLLEGNGLNYVQPIFNIINKFIKRAKDVCDLVIIVSDHGFEIKYSRVNITALLKKKGLINVHFKLMPRRIISEKFTCLKEKREKRFLPTKSITQLFNLIPKEFIKEVFKVFAGRIPLRMVYDIGKSHAYIVERPTWGIHVNKDINTVESVVKSAPGIEKVLRRNDIYKGPYTTFAPDLICVPKKQVMLGTNPFGSIVERIYSSDHNMEGVFIALGDDVDTTLKLSSVSVYDITPTVLYYMNLPLPSPCEGKALKHIFTIERKVLKRYNYLIKFKIYRVRKLS